MAKQPETVETEFYLTIRPKWDGYNKDAEGRPILRGITADRITQGRPENLKGGSIATRLHLVVDAKTFVPVQPSATIKIDSHDVEVIYEANALSSELYVPDTGDQ